MLFLDRKFVTVLGMLIIGISIFSAFYEPNLFFVIYLIGITVMIIPSLYGAIKSTRKLKIKVDTLMVIATVGAIILGHLEDAVIILLLYNIAEILEDVFLDKAKRNLEDLTRNVPRKVSIIENGNVRDVDIEECKVGEVVIIKPGQMVPFDGEVVESSTLVDESSVTGEPYPVLKPPGSKVYSGSIVLKKPLRLKIERDFDNSLLMNIVNRVLNSLQQRSEFERYVRRVANYMAPLVLVSFLLVVAFGYFINDFPTWVYRGLAILVLGCPSAFLISTAIVSYRALSELLKEGILVKGSYYFESLSKAKIVALDKTGTVTLGKPEVVEIIPLNESSPLEILRLAASLEAYSSHPIARAIMEEASKKSIEVFNVIEVEEVLGKGIIGTIEGGNRILVGNKELLESFGIRAPSVDSKEGVIVYVALDNKVLGAIKLLDKPMKGSRELSKEFEKLGIKTVLITGDKRSEAERVAEYLGVKEWYSDMKPDEKVRVINELKKEGRTIMVGDGINDAMSLAEADVGIAVIKRGIDIVQTSAGVEIHKWDNLLKLPNLIKIGKKYMSTVKKIVLFAGIAKLTLIVLALLGFLPLWGAVLGDDGLTIVLALYALSFRVKL